MEELDGCGRGVGGGGDEGGGGAGCEGGEDGVGEEEHKGCAEDIGAGFEGEGELDGGEGGHDVGMTWLKRRLEKDVFSVSVSVLGER